MQILRERMFCFEEVFPPFSWREGNSGCLNPHGCQTKCSCSIYEPPCLSGKLDYVVLPELMRRFDPLMYFFLHCYCAWEEDHVLHH